MEAQVTLFLRETTGIQTGRGEGFLFLLFLDYSGRSDVFPKNFFWKYFVLPQRLVGPPLDICPGMYYICKVNELTIYSSPVKI